MAEKKAVRIQNSILNGIEKKALVWLAERQPRWVVSDLLTIVGIIGAVMIAAGFALCGKNIHWLWLSVAGFFVNWYGDSLDGTIARVRDTQRPVYGYYLDHTVDVINEALMFIGVGLSYLMRKLGPTEFRVIACILIMLIIFLPGLREFHTTVRFFGHDLAMGPLDIPGLVIFIVLMFIYICTVISDAKGYAKIDPLPKRED